jgi:hypothetical protein
MLLPISVSKGDFSDALRKVVCRKVRRCRLGPRQGRALADLSAPAPLINCTPDGPHTRDTDISTIISEEATGKVAF